MTSPEHLVVPRDGRTAEDPSRGRVTPLPSAPKPGETAEVLTVTFRSGGAEVAPAPSLCRWPAQRKANITGTEGRQVAVDVKRSGDPEVGALLGQGQ